MRHNDCGNILIAVLKTPPYTAKELWLYHERPFAEVRSTGVMPNGSISSHHC